MNGRIIYKYPFEIEEQVEILMPKSAKTLSIQEQRGKLFLWALIDPSEECHVKKRFYVFGTGNYITLFQVDEMKHISTIQQGKFVWHIFE